MEGMTRDRGRSIRLLRRVRPRPERSDREEEHPERSQDVMLARRHHTREDASDVPHPYARVFAARAATSTNAASHDGHA